MNVKIYSTPYCPYCKLAKEFMMSKNIPFTEVDVMADEKERDEMVQKTGQLGVPVIEVDGKIMVGYQKQKLAELLGVSPE